MEVQDYNSEPVLYCKHCLSLKIKSVDDALDADYLDFCDDCGSTEINETDIYSWERMYEQKYGKNFLTGEVKYGRENTNPGCSAA